MKVFLSSTYWDLVDHRAKAAQAIERLGQHGIRMEVFGARPDEATASSLDEVASSDVLVGIYAHRYGTIDTDSGISITEREFDFAQQQQKDILCFMVDEDFPWMPAHIDPEPDRSRLRAFKQKISDSLIRDTFTTPDDLAYKVSSSLGRLLLSTKIKSDLESVPGRNSVSTPQGRDQVSRRAARLETVLRGSRLLLVNDVPREMNLVVQILRDLGIEVEVTTTSESALQLLEDREFDAVISDMRRGDVPDEGLRFFSEMREQNLDLPTIFTVGQFEPDRGTPPHAFGITNRLDEMLNLLFDALERARG